MRKLLWLICLVTYCQSAGAQQPGPVLKDRGLMDSILTLAEHSAVKRDSVDWNTLKQELWTIHEDSGIIPAVQAMLTGIQDAHGKLIIDDISYQGKPKDWTGTTMVLSDSLLQAYYQMQVPLADTVFRNIYYYGYVRIPGIPPTGTEDQMAKAIQQVIQQQYEKNHPAGWIIDLRLNGGGSMYPMLTGLNAFWGNDTLAAFNDPVTGTYSWWRLQNGELFFDDQQVTSYQVPAGPDLSKVPVIVLLSAATASSGEALAIALSGRKATTMMGESTAGLTSTTSWNVLRENIVLQLTVSYFADRNGMVYAEEPVVPRIQIEGGDAFENLSRDKKVQNAVWLLMMLTTD